MAPIERAGFKPKEWRARYNISRAKHQRMKNAGTAPRETNVDGVTLIMREDDDAWRERMRAASTAAAALPATDAA